MGLILPSRTRLAGAQEFQGGAASPVPDVELMRAFGTTRSTAEQVGSRGYDFTENLERSEAIYFVVYKDGPPYEIRFVGCSGD